MRTPFLHRVSLALPILALLAAATLDAQQPAAKPARPARAAAPAPTPVKVATVEGITEYRLPNGLQVLLLPDQTKPVVTVNITYLVGSRHENYGETGMAHLLEHLLFKGSTRHPEIGEELTAHGASFNGTTWYDRTNYFESFPATPENLEWALDLEADRMVNSYVSKAHLESEMTVVRNEFEMGENSPQGILEERLFSTAYLWHNYGNSTIGARSDIENVPIERLKGFYRKYYQPDNAILVVAGKFDEAAVLKRIAQLFGPIPRPSREGDNRLWPTYTVEPVQDGERSVTLRRVGDEQILMAGYHVPAGSDSDFAPVLVLAQVLGSAPSGRLYQALVETKRAAAVWSTTYQLYQPSLLLAGAQLRREDTLAVAQAAFLAALDSASQRPPTEEEVARAKQTILKNIELSLTQTDAVGVALSEWASRGDWRLIFINRDRVRAVTPADVQRVAAAYLKPSNRTFGVFLPTDKPDRADIPPVPDIAALVKDYKGDTTMTAGEAFDPTPANIDARTVRSELPSGMKLALLPKATRGQTVSGTIRLHFGTEQGLSGKATTASLAGAMLMRGTTAHTRLQLKDEFDRLKAQVGLRGTAEGVTVSFTTVRANLPAVLRLAGEVLRQASFDSTEFVTLQRERLAALEAQRTDPIALAQTALARATQAYAPGHPRYVSTIEERIANTQAVTVADAKRFWVEFYGVGAGEAAIVGDFDPGEASAALAEVFGTWKSPAAYARIPELYADKPAVTEQIETPDKANAILLAGTNLPLSESDPGYPALAIGDYIYGGSAFDSRLIVRMRQEEGLSYGAGSALEVSPEDQAGQLLVYAISAPENTGKVVTAFREVTDSAVAGGFTPEEVSKGKAGYLQQLQLARTDDSQLSGQLTERLFLGRTMQWDATLESAIGALTPAQVSAGFRAFVNPSRMTVITAGDFAKGKAPPAQP
ncbi:MAG TPA: pitrilysin family protein [Gemmatimonadales bacterium]|nr:pitrilysin family protein [Gemmatimonadales bacterium]